MSNDLDFLNKSAADLDAEDPLKDLRSKFKLPAYQAIGADLVSSSLREHFVVIC